MNSKRTLYWLGVLLAGLLILGLAAGCGEAPGVPHPEAPAGGAVAPQPIGGGEAGAEAGGEASAAEEGGEEEVSGEALEVALASLEPITADDVELTEGTVQIELVDFELGTPVLKVKAGTVTFFFDNTSTHAHNYRIAAWDDHEAVVYPGPKIGARKQREVDIDLEPGVYYVFCNLGDHEERGMVGKLFVEP